MVRSVIVVAAVVVVWLAMASAAEALSCGQVVNRLLPCRDYLRNGGSLPATCCSGARTLNREANTASARQQACSCMKTAAKAYKAQTKYAAAVPGKCGVNIGYAVNFNIDCKTVR